MSKVMDEEFKRWTAKRKAALEMEIIHGKTTVAEASRSFDIPPSAIEEWVDEGREGTENAPRAKPLDVRDSTSGNSRSCRKPMEKPCWSCAPAKCAPG